jgi:hypothetical protein
MGKTVTLNGKRIVLDEEEPRGEDVRRVAELDEDRLLIDGETRQIIGPKDRVQSDELYDAPRFSKGTPSGPVNEHRGGAPLRALQAPA